MKILKHQKFHLSFYYITLFVFLQVVGGFTGIKVMAEGENADDTMSETITETQKNIIIDHCNTMKDTLKSLQKVDSRARVYLGRYYETILSNFITPLNLRLVENNITNTKLLENQTNFATRRGRFVDDFIVYQQALEETVNVDCKAEPLKFYDKLKEAREKRKSVSRDVTKLRELTDEQIKLVEELKNGLK